MNTVRKYFRKEIRETEHVTYEPKFPTATLWALIEDERQNAADTLL